MPVFFENPQTFHYPYFTLVIRHSMLKFFAPCLLAGAVWREFLRLLTQHGFLELFVGRAVA
jgi:hypothetical protein